MPNLLDLPDHCLESIASQFNSRYFSYQDLSYVLSTFNNDHYVDYILGEKFCSPQLEYFDNIYINLNPSNKPVTFEDRKNYRITNVEYVLSKLNSNRYLELQKLSLAPLIRIWTGDPNLWNILALYPYVIRYRGNKRAWMYRDAKDVDNNLEVKESIFNKIWGGQQLLLKDYKYFKNIEIDNINDLTIELGDDDELKEDFEGLRYLHPTVLKIIIKSSKKLTYSGEAIARALDLSNVDDFTLLYPLNGAVVTCWDAIILDLEQVTQLYVSVGSIENVDEFFDYIRRSIDKFKLALHCESKQYDLDLLTSKMKRVMRTEDYEITIKD